MKNQFVIAPTFRIGEQYLRSKDRNPKEWTILALSHPDVLYKIRGVRGGIAEDIVTAPIDDSRSYVRLSELQQYLKMADIEVIPVSY